MDPEESHLVETYKSLVAISGQAMKLLALLNGGAAVALLAYLGNALGKVSPVPDMRLAMGGYVLGLLFCAAAALFSYVAQLRLFESSIRSSRYNVGISTHYLNHRAPLFLGMVLCILSLIAFAVGSLSAIWQFSVPLPAGSSIAL